MPAPYLTETVAKGWTHGTHRATNPDETLHTISRHFDTIGITRLADITGLDTIGIPVFAAIRPNSESLSVSQGKGLSPMLARVSAAMESIELFHAEKYEGCTVTASYRDLTRQGELVCDPHYLNQSPSSIYHDDLPLRWTRGTDLTSGARVCVPCDLVGYKGVVTGPKAPLFISSSNGLASGNHHLEAISHAICEVIERDALLLWGLRAASREPDDTYVRLDTIDSPACRELLLKLEHAGVSVFIWEQTSDVGIPSFGCVLLEHQRNGLSPLRGVFSGYGCHLSKEIALVRAITEAAQSRLTYISGARDDMYRSEYALLKADAYHEKWVAHFDRVRPRRDFAAIPSLETASLESDVGKQLELLQAAGLDQVVVVDLARPEYGIPVVRVVIPRMEYAYEGQPTRLGLRATQVLLRERYSDELAAQLL